MPFASPCVKKKVSIEQFNDMNKNQLNHLTARTDENQWIAISDLMAGLMIIFLFVALVFILRHQRRVDSYQEVRLQIFHELQQEFETDLKRWDAEIDKHQLSVRFKDIEVLFKQGKAHIPPKFKEILDDFFPRYLAILVPKYTNEIKEMKIKGHTSSEGKKNQSKWESYFYNMQLSQDRTRNVHKYVMRQSTSQPYRDWLIKTMTANGLSFSHIITNRNGREDRRASRRVEFEIQTKADKILKPSHFSQE